MFKPLYLLTLSLALAGSLASAEENTLKEGAKEVGHATGNALHEVGEGAKKVGKEVAEAAREVGHATRDGAKELVKAMKNDDSTASTTGPHNK